MVGKKWNKVIDRAFYLSEDVSAVDLDTNTVTICLEKRNEDMTAKLMPKKACKTLKTTLEALLDKCTAHQKLARQMEATNDGAIDFVFRVNMNLV